MALGNISAILVIIASMIGYGIVGLPYAFAHMGWLGGIVLLIISSIFSGISIYLLFLTSSSISKNKEKSHQITFFEFFSTISSLLGDLCNIILVIFAFFSTIIYHNTINEFIIILISGITGKTYSKYLIAGSVAIIEIGLSFLPSISALSKVSCLSIIICTSVGLLFLRFSLLKLKNLDITIFEYKGIQKSLGIIIFSLTSHIVIPEIFNSLNSSASIFMISVLGVSIGTILYLLIGLTGYFLGGSILKKDNNIFNYLILGSTPFSDALYKSSFDSNGYTLFATFILFIIVLICSYALLMFSAKKYLFNTINRNITIYSIELNSNKIGLYSIALLWIISTTLISTLYYPLKFLNISITYLANIISFLLPPIAYISNCGKKNSFLYLTSLMVILFGIISISYYTFDLIRKGN